MKFWGWVRSKTGWINLDTTFAALISSGIDRAESALRFWVNLGPDFAHVVTQDLGGNCVAKKVPIFTKKNRVLPFTKTRFFLRWQCVGENFFSWKMTPFRIGGSRWLPFGDLFFALLRGP